MSSHIITINVEGDLLWLILVAIIAIITYVGILEYRFRRVENHPFLKALRQLQEEQMIDMARNMLPRRHERGDTE